jgi:hypothetical protein
LEIYRKEVALSNGSYANRQFRIGAIAHLNDVFGLSYAVAASKTHGSEGSIFGRVITIELRTGEVR